MTDEILFSEKISPPVKTKLTATGEGFDTYFYGNDKLAKKLIRHLHPSRKDHAKKYWSSSCINLGWDSQARRGKKYQIVFHTIETNVHNQDFALGTAKLPSGDTEVKLHVTAIANHGRGKFKKFIKDLFSWTSVIVGGAFLFLFIVRL